MSWSSKRKFNYIAILILVVLTILGVIVFKFFYHPPTCQDGKQNQKEEGIDCGGPCLTVCGFEIINPIIHWSRVSKMLDGKYSATTFIENPNVSAEAYNVPYIFKLYDEEGLLVNEYTGTTFIPANKTFPIFTGMLDVGKRDPQKVVFEFTENPHWVETTPDPEVLVDDILFSEKNGLPRVSARVYNHTAKEIKNIELVVLLLDDQNNLINSSKTIVDSIKKNSSEEVVFTWPASFDRTVFKVNIFFVSKLK
jgi:hypothetical protein